MSRIQQAYIADPEYIYELQHWPKKLFFGNGWLKSFFQVVRLGFVYASIYLETY
jgi:hypothetical protein